jgi:hypothetical protein
MSTILLNSVIEWHKIKGFRVDTASLVRSASAWAERRRTFLLRRNTRLAFMKLIEWTQLAE